MTDTRDTAQSRVPLDVFRDPVTGVAYREDGEEAFECPACGNAYAYEDLLDPDIHGCEGGLDDDAEWDAVKGEWVTDDDDT